MDYSIWIVMKERVRRHKASTLKGLKNAIKVEWGDLELDLIDNTLKYWAKRCRLIYYAHRSHIEYDNYIKMKEEKYLYFVSK